VSLARDLVLDMMARGHSQAEIGRLIGRDSSMISQIASGKRGENYGASAAGYLRVLSDQLVDAAAAAPGQPLEVVHPPRRLDSSGRVAHTRNKLTHGGAHSGVSTVKKQATSNGARSLAPQIDGANEDGRRGALTITCGPHANISKSGGSKKGNRGESDVDVDVPDLDELLDLIAYYDGNVTDAVVELLQNHDRAGEGLTTDDILGLEFRSWTE
jgi:hypothetical protein